MRKKHPFRNALLATVGTVSGIVLLLALKSTPDPSAARTGDLTAGITASASASSPGSASSSSSRSTTAAPSKAPGKEHVQPSSTASASPPRPVPTAPAKTGSAPSAAKTTSAAPTTRSVTGATAQTKYGPVQVRITLDGGRITGANAVQCPDETPRSQDISSMAVPRLNQETLEAQSANIDTVSGATYTSAGYRQSLQSALDRAGV